MPTPYVTRREAFAAKIEAVPGTAETPTFAADAIRLIEASEPERGFLSPNLTDDVNTGKMGVVFLASPSGRFMRFRCRAALIGPGAAITASVLPELHPILLASAFSHTVSGTGATSKVDYVAADDPTTFLTCVLQKSGKLYKIAGAQVESFQLQCNAGQFPTVTFAVVGFMVDTVEQAFSAPTYDNVNFPIWRQAGSLVIGGHTGTVVGKDISLDLGLQLAHRADSNSEDAHAGVIIVRRVPTLTVTAEVPTLSQWNPDADLKARTARALTAIFGKYTAALSAFNKITLQLDDCRVMEGIADRDESGLRVYTVPYRVGIPASGSEIKITFSD